MYEKARQYTRRHLDPGEVRKIQQFLRYTMNDGARWRNPKEYYKGEIDGNFTPELYEAITQYQKDNGFVPDGM